MNSVSTVGKPLIRQSTGPTFAKPVSSTNDKMSFHAVDKLPKWSGGDAAKVRAYYLNHRETWLDRLIGWLASKLGIIVHGNLSGTALEEKLRQFDIHKLLVSGPYENPVLSLKAQVLIQSSLQDVDKVVDVHLHNMGYDEGNYLNPAISARGIAKWMDYFTFLVLRYASGITAAQGSTDQARKRIHSYVRHFPKLHA